MGRLISIGACIGLIVVVMILMLGQTRVGFAMARDGLLPRGLAKVHPRFGTPYIFTIVTGLVVAAIGGLVDLATLVNLVSIGTLFAFILVSIGVVCCAAPAPTCRGPSGPRAHGGGEPLGAAVLYLMLNLTGGTWVRFLVWMAIGLVVYFAYGRHHSRLWQEEPSERAPTTFERNHGTRSSLLGRGPFVTDGGLETDLIFHHGMDLPAFAAFRSWRGSPAARVARLLRRTPRSPAGTGSQPRPRVAPWRANPDWGSARLRRGRPWTG